jgi:TPR repeat protein
MQFKLAGPLVLFLFMLVFVTGCGRSKKAKPAAAAPKTNAPVAAAPVAPRKLDDIGEIKILARDGDVHAQLRLAEIYRSTAKPAEAVKLYESVLGKTNEAQAQYQLGNLLLFGAAGNPRDQSVSPNPGDGLKWTYCAATNGHIAASRNVSRALQSGLGCPVNLMHSYAWLSFLAEKGDSRDRQEMNKLALKLSSEDIEQGKTLALGMKTGAWPVVEFKLATKMLAPLNLQGITHGKTPLAIINGRTIAETESTTVQTGKTTLRIQCLKIETASVSVQVDGESEPRLLQLK